VRSRNNEAFLCASVNGRLELFTWLVDTFELTVQDMRSDDNYALRYACSSQHLNILQFLIGRFQLSEDDYFAPVDRNWISLIKKSCKEENRFIVSWLITNFPKNDILLNDIPEDCKEFVKEVFDENEIMIKPASKFTDCI